MNVMPHLERAGADHKGATAAATSAERAADSVDEPPWSAARPLPSVGTIAPRVLDSPPTGGSMLGLAELVTQGARE